MEQAMSSDPQSPATAPTAAAVTTTTSPTPSPLAGNLVRRPRESAETLDKSMTTILCKSGYLTAERQQQIDAIARHNRELDRAADAKRLRARSGLPGKFINADFDDVEF